jgi:hypothetical protein
MLPTVKEELQAYFVKLQKEFKEPLVIQYDFHPWKKFVLSTNNSNPMTLQLHTKYAENQIQSFLDHVEIKDATWKENLYDFDYKFNFESEVESIFRDIAFECWNKARSVTQNRIRATLKEANGGSHMYDLGTGKVSD